MIGTPSSRVRCNTLRKALLPLSLVLLAGCATPFRADVSRFQELPAPAGQSFTVSAGNPDNAGGIEFSGYADLVRQELTQLGYRVADAPGQADLVVSLDYGVDKGTQRIVEDYDPFYYPPSYYWGYGPGYFHRGFGGRAFVYGWHDPFLWGGYGYRGYPNVSSYTVYESYLTLKIDRAADGKRLFEGKAEARSRSNHMSYLVPNLIEAMFTGFPGNSGETVRISVAPEDKAKQGR